MSRRRPPADVTVTLFPFLAVLICTMGALIVLLVVVVRRASQQPPSAPNSPPPIADTKTEAPTVDLAAVQQQQQDFQWQAKVLAASREKTLQRLKAQQIELSRTEDQTRRLNARFQELQQQAEQLAQAAQDESTQAAASASQLAAVQARIEATRQQLQQEKARVDQQHPKYSLVPYVGPHGTKRRAVYIECRGDRVLFQPEGVALTPDDFEAPLGIDNALATALRATREYLLNTGVTRSSGEPYPLLLVRSNGARAYAACRSALQGWDDEFGYELISDDMEMAYPPSDPELGALLRSTIEQVRARRAAAGPGDRTGWVLALTPRRGGFVREGGAAAESAGDARSEAPPATEAGSVGDASDPESADARPPAAAEGSPMTHADRASAFSGAEPGTVAAGTGGPAKAGTNQPSTQATANAPGAGAGLASIAKSQGKNWALPNAADGAIGITRPVRVTCGPGRLVLEPEPGSNERRTTIAVDSTGQNAARQFVSALWERIDAWGLAGPGVYWKPVLRVAVESGAEPRFAELVRLLDDSGLEIRRR